MLDDALNYLKLRRLKGNHCTSQYPSTGPRSIASEALLVPESQKVIVKKDFEAPHSKLFVLSATDEGGVKRLASLLFKHLSGQLSVPTQEDYLVNLAHTLCSKRSSLPWKTFVVANSIQGLCEELESSQLKVVRSSTSRNVGFIFTGQGAQWYAMGRELIEYPVFSDSIYGAQAYLRTLGCSWSLWDELCRDEATTNVHHPEYSQPICTALQIALYDLLQSWGLRPAAVLGHSSGEIAAAYGAEALSKESALKVAFYRGSLAAKLAKSAHGAMMSVGLSEDEILPYLRSMASDVVVGCINSPRNVTLSGPDQQIDNLKAVFDQDKIFARKLNVSIAYHSKAISAIATEYQVLISDITTREPSLNRPVMISSVTGKRIAIDELRRGEYWVKNLVSPVRFSEALSQLCLPPLEAPGKIRKSYKDSLIIHDLIEIGPHSALRAPIRETLDAFGHGLNISYDSILTRKVSAPFSSISAAGRLYCSGHKINFAAINTPIETPCSLQVLTDLPEYPFNHEQSHWQESRLSKNFRFRDQIHHELLGTPVTDWNPMEARWRFQLRQNENPWIVDHRVSGLEIYPAAGLLVMAIEGARQLADEHRPVLGYQMKDVIFKKALIIGTGTDEAETQLNLRPLNLPKDKASDWSEFRIYTYEHGDWAENCRGTISVQYRQEDVEVDRGREAEEECSHFKNIYHEAVQSCETRIPSSRLYGQFRDLGIDYGPSFQVLDDVRHSDGRALGIVSLRKWTTNVNELDYQKHVIHPTALDGILQLAFPAMSTRGAGTMIPDRIRSLWVSSQGLGEIGNESVRAYAKDFQGASNTVSSVILALDATTEEPRIVLRGLQMSAVTGRQVSYVKNSRRLCYSFDWKPDIDLLSTQELAAHYKTLVESRSAPDELIEDTEFLCFSSILSAVEELGSKPISGKQPHFVRYVEWMQRQCLRYDAGELIHWRPEWRLLVQDKTYIEKVLLRVGSSSAQGRLCAEIAKNLLLILEGRTDALDLLFSSELAAMYYKEANESGTAACYLDSLVHKNPGLKILEVGAGTGGMTSSILHVLTSHGNRKSQTPRFASYVFTDISPGFFEKAKERFKDHVDRMTFMVLNIENDPLEQGFLEGEYDFIVASNVGQLFFSSNL